MSYPYQTFVPDYSSPTTPQGFASPWEVEQQHASAQQQGQTPTSQDHHNISPQVFQHQLSPIEATTPQEQQQQEHHQLLTSFEPPRTIQVPVRQPPAPPPSQYRFDNIDESHFLRQRENTDTQKRASSKSRSRVGVDEMRSSRSPTDSSAGAVGPSRVPHARAAHTQSHPYKRPLSAAGPVGSTLGMMTSGQQAVVRSSSSSTRKARSDDVLHERISQVRAGFGSTMPILPAVGSGKAVPCPAISVWRDAQSSSEIHGFNRDSSLQRVVTGEPEGPMNRYADLSFPPSVKGESSCSQPSSSLPFVSPGSGANTPVQTPAGRIASVINPQGQTQRQLVAPKRYGIRSDIFFDKETNRMTVNMELPGVKKNDVRILMNVCPYTHVRQLTVAGQSHSVLPTGPYTNQERRFGYFSRTVVVPVETKPGDIVANMEDGVLTLSVATGVPTAREEPQEITIQ